MTYQGLVEQADGANRAEAALGPASSHDLGDAYLGYAGQSLFGSGGLLTTVNTLSELNQQALEGQSTSLWADPVVIAAVATAGVVVRLESPGGNAADNAVVLNLTAVQPARATFDADLGSAQTTGGLLIGIPIATVVIGALVFLAVKPRLDEYRGVDT